MKRYILYAGVNGAGKSTLYQTTNCKTVNEARCLPGTLEALRADGVQIVILDSPEIYSEYAPYSYVEDVKQFIDMVSQMNRVA